MAARPSDQLCSTKKSPWSLADRWSVENAETIEEPILFRIYETDDGIFRGNLDEVGTMSFLFVIYSNIITYAWWRIKKVMAYENKNKTDGAAQTRTDSVLFRIYEAPDGFRGLYDEVLQHERNLITEAQFIKHWLKV